MYFHPHTHCSVHVTGHWLLPKETATHGYDMESECVPNLMTPVPLPTADGKVLYVGFGSMEEVFPGEINWERLVTVLYKGKWLVQQNLAGLVDH